MSITHLLDTSAILAHFFDEPGADEVGRLWSKPLAKIGVCAVTVAELRGRLAEELADTEEAATATGAYLDELTTCLAVDRTVAEAAIHVRSATNSCIPLVDALIAGCALAHGSTLVHRDRHMAAIPAGIVAQLALPAAQEDSE